MGLRTRPESRSVPKISSSSITVAENIGTLMAVDGLTDSRSPFGGHVISIEFRILFVEF